MRSISAIVPLFRLKAYPLNGTKSHQKAVIQPIRLPVGEKIGKREITATSQRGSLMLIDPLSLLYWLLDRLARER
jgi:hypothetical protein